MPDQLDPRTQKEPRTLGVPVGSPPAGPVRRRLRTGLKLLVAAVLAGLLVYRLRFSPVTVVAHRVVPGPVVAEVLGTGTLGLRGRETVEVAEGLSAGEQIVRPFEGQTQSLADGQRITAK